MTNIERGVAVMAGEFSGDRVHNACGLCCTKIQNFTVQRGDQLILIRSTCIYTVGN